MIRSSALLTAVAMAMLVAGAFAGELRLIYLSIAVSILAAVTLAAGVLLRRRELFGEAGAAPQTTQPGWAGAETAKPVPARPGADDRVVAGRGAPREDNRRDHEHQGDPAARLRKAGSGTAAGTGSARWPASIAGKGAPSAARRGGGRQAGRGRAARSPAGRGPAAREPVVREPGGREPGAREPARSDWAGHERRDREPAGREPAAREAIGREPVPTGSTGPGTGWPPPPGREAGPGRSAEPGRDQDPAAAPPGRDHAGRGPHRGAERDRAAAARAGRPRTAPGQDRDQEVPARGGREQAGRERDEAAAGQQAEAFRLPPPSERTRARAEELGRALSGNQGGDDFWDRVSDELVEDGGQDPARPAWSATAGPRAMGTGSAARRAPGEAGDELEEAGPAGFGQSEPVPWDRGAIPPPPDEERDRDEQPADAGWDRVFPRYVDDVASRGRQRREPERDPAAAGEPDEDAAPAGATGPAARGAWSAWSSGGRGTADARRTGRAEAEGPGTGETPAGVSAAAGTGADPAADAADETDDHEAEAGARGDDAAAEAADRAGAGAAAESAGESDRTASAAADGATPLDAEVTVVPGIARYHRRGCILIRFLSDGDLETTTRRDGEAEGLVPCKACQPNKPASADG